MGYGGVYAGPCGMPALVECLHCSLASCMGLAGYGASRCLCVCVCLCLCMCVHESAWGMVGYGG